MSSSTSINNLSHEQKKKIINKMFSEIMGWGIILQKDFPIIINFVTELECLWELKKDQQLTHKIINLKMPKIAKCLIELFPSLKNNVNDYWNAWYCIINNMPGDTINISDKLRERLPDIQEIDSMHSEFMHNIFHDEQKINNVTLHALFQIHISRIEKIEYSFMSDLEKNIKFLDKEFINTSNLNLKNIFSVNTKIQKDYIVIDGRALRNAFAHKKYKIIKNDNIEILFENILPVPPFNIKFTADEFVLYSRDMLDLHTIMFVITSLIILHSFLHDSIDSKY